MGTQFAPDIVPVCDPGTAPEIFVDGLALYAEQNGIVRSAFYSNQLILPDADDTGPRQIARVIVLKLLCTTEAQMRIRQALMQHIAGVDPSFRVELARLRS